MVTQRNKTSFASNTPPLCLALCCGVGCFCSCSLCDVTATPSIHRQTEKEDHHQQYRPDTPNFILPPEHLPTRCYVSANSTINLSCRNNGACATSLLMLKHKLTTYYAYFFFFFFM